MSDDALSASSAHAAEPAHACAARTSHWLTLARDPACFDTILFARLIAAREVRGEESLLGLSAAQWRGLVSRHFTHEPAAMPSVESVAIGLNTEQHLEFVAKLRELMLQYANPAVPLDDAQCLASIITHACLRPDHLWRDLGLSGRDDVSAMLDRYFPTLAALNVTNLRWKRFLAQQLALSLGQTPGPAPGCPGCEDFGFCFPNVPDRPAPSH